MADSNAMTTLITDLNNNCLRAILLYVPVADRIKLRRVCKRFRRITDDCWRSVKKLSILDPTLTVFTAYELQNVKTNEDARKIGTGLAGVYNFIILKSSNPRLIEGVMKRCGEFLTTLTDSREGKPGSVLSQAIKYCRNLETLVTCVTTKAEDKQLNQLLALSKKLKVLELNISFKNFKVFSHTLPTESLEELGMTSSNMIPPSLMLMCQKEILRKCHSLKQLDFNSIDDELVQLIGTKIQLEGLRLSTIHANHLTQTGLTPILNLRNLRVLYIISPEMPRRTRVHPPVNDDFLTALAENLRLLESLTFEAPARITDEGFAKLASLPNLKKLSIIYCQGVTDKYMVLFHKLEIFALIDCNVRDEGAIKFLEKSQNVKQLNLEGTHITNKTLVAAVQATKKRTNGIRLDLFNTDTNTVEWALTERSPLLQIVNQYHRKVIRINSKQTIYLPIQISN